MKTKFFFLLSLAIFGLSSFYILPECYRDKIKYRLMWPYVVYYVRHFSDELTEYKSRMYTFYNDSDDYGNKALIAHTGGVGEFSHVSCVEGVQDALKKGFRYIEVDLYQTCDGHLIATHTWEELARQMNLEVSQIKKMPLDELKKRKILGKYTILSDADICRFMNEYPEMILVTDRIQDMDLLKEKIYYPARSIVEVASEYAYLKALKLGFRYPAMTILNNKGIERAEAVGIPLVVVHAQMLCSQRTGERIKGLHRNRVTVMVHHADICDKEAFINEHLGKSCSMIYTNSWSPATPPPVLRN